MLQPDKQRIQPGDRVAYSHHFLQSISAFTGELPQARGTVTALIPLGHEITLAEVDWGNPDLPPRVNVRNLCRVRDTTFFD